ncbi:MAG: hypothetical protein J0G33_06665 [Afipia felis]|nr:hypothetical protein [Afipia felis]
MKKHFVTGAVILIGLGSTAHAAFWNGPRNFECGILSRNLDVKTDDPVYKFRIRIRPNEKNYTIQATTLSGKITSRAYAYDVVSNAISWKKKIITWAGADRNDKSLVTGGTFRFVDGHWFYKEAQAQVENGSVKERGTMLAGCHEEDGE